MLESLILYLKGMRILMFQLSGFYYTQDLLETISGWQIHCQKATNTWGKHRGHAPESPVPVASILASTWWKPGSFWHRFLGRPCARICDLPDRYHGGRVVRWRAETVSC